MLATVAGAVLAVAGVIVCSKCGHEASSNATACGHCKAELKPAPPDGGGATPGGGPAPPARVGHTFLSSGKLEFLDSAVVTNEVRIGQEYFRRGQSAPARLFFINAAALCWLTRPDGSSEVGERIMRLAAQSAAQGRLVEKECPVCGGSGKMKMKALSLKGEVFSVDVAGKLCPRCSGTKIIRVPGTARDWADRMSKAAEVFAQAQKSRGFARVGDAWAPGELEGKFSIEQTANVTKAAAGPCPACAGLGRIDCEDCAGLGELKCANKDCQFGQVGVMAGGKLSDHKIIRTEDCPVCRGKGVVTCGPCKGEGAQPCVKCAGTGERAACNKCGGEGARECRRCRGKGTVKDAPCAACGGEKIELCPSCGGNGKRR
ncbi:MAG: hypothetical protein QME60_06170 [Verrucomicrobiota bacterium]|nr:hypothetical protein [Verrucomicrobiota bacterium]